MADRIPVCSGDDAVKAFERVGWSRARQRGSHVTLVRAGSIVVLTVPMHRELGPGILRSLIRRAGLSVREFEALLKN